MSDYKSQLSIDMLILTKETRNLNHWTCGQLKRDVTQLTCWRSSECIKDSQWLHLTACSHWTQTSRQEVTRPRSLNTDVVWKWGVNSFQNVSSTGGILSSRDCTTIVAFKKCLNRTRLTTIGFFTDWEFAKPYGLICFNYRIRCGRTWYVPDMYIPCSDGHLCYMLLGM